MTRSLQSLTCISARIFWASCRWDLFSAWPYGGTAIDDEKLQSLTCIFAKILRASCHWDLFSTWPYGGTVSDGEKAHILDLYLCRNLEGRMPLGSLLSMTSTGVYYA